MFKTQPMRIILILLQFFLIKEAFGGAIITGSAVYSKQTDKDFYLQEKISPSLSYGYFNNIGNYTGTIQTNRLLNKTQRQFIQSKSNGKAYELKSRLRIDTLLLGYKFKQFNPSLIITNARLERTLTVRKVDNTILFGLNFNYFVDKNISLSTSIIAPNKDFGLVGAGLLSINYLF